jgi:hypothetical protein
MEAMVCEQCSQRWQVEPAGPGGWRLRESPAPWAYGWLVSAEQPCCPFDGGELTRQVASLSDASLPVVSGQVISRHVAGR